jgi:hypothetical protein
MGDEAAGAVDFTYLEGFAGGDRTVVREVLGLFRQSVDDWTPKLTPAAPDWRDVVHTIKGAGLGIGARRLGALCARAEAEGPDRLGEVRAGLSEAAAEIDAYLARA